MKRHWEGRITDEQSNVNVIMTYLSNHYVTHTILLLVLKFRDKKTTATLYKEVICLSFTLFFLNYT